MDWFGLRTWRWLSTSDLVFMVEVWYGMICGKDKDNPYHGLEGVSHLPKHPMRTNWVGVGTHAAFRNLPKLLPKPVVCHNACL